MRSRWLPESSGYSPPDPCSRAATCAAAVRSPVCIFDLSNLPLSNFRCLRLALVRLEFSVSPRVRTNLSTWSSPTGLRIPTNVSGLHPLSRASTLKLRLERFRTSHARVLGNLLFSEIVASEIRREIVGFLLKTSTCCGDGWKRSCRPVSCTFKGAKGLCLGLRVAPLRGRKNSLCQRENTRSKRRLFCPHVCTVSGTRVLKMIRRARQAA